MDQQPAPMSGSEALLAEQEAHGKRTLKIVLIVIGAAVVITGAVFVWLAFQYQAAAPTGFATVEYDNGAGNAFQVEFYKSNRVAPAPGGKLKELISGQPAGNLFPLAMTISKSTSTEAPEALLNCSGMPVALSIANKPSGHTIKLCQYMSNNTINGYIGAWQSGDAYYAVTFEQHLDANEATSSPDVARAALKRLNLPAYNDDIRRIAATIKPLN